MNNTKPSTAAGEQLSLLSPSDLPVQFRLDQRTRLRGLAHVAEIRAQLAQRGYGLISTASTSTQKAA